MSNQRSAERGIAMIEFAIVLPLLILLTLCVSELVRTTSVKKLATQLSREAANLAFRKCIPAKMSDTELSGCLETQRDVIARFVEVNDISPAPVVILSYYELGTVSGADPVRRVVFGGDTTYPTKFASSGSSISTEIKALTTQGIYIGEAYIPYQPLFGSLMDFFRFDQSFVYDATTV